MPLQLLLREIPQFLIRPAFRCDVEQIRDTTLREDRVCTEAQRLSGDRYTTYLTTIGCPSILLQWSQSSSVAVWHFFSYNIPTTWKPRSLLSGCQWWWWRRRRGTYKLPALFLPLMMNPSSIYSTLPDDHHHHESITRWGCWGKRGWNRIHI